MVSGSKLLPWVSGTRFFLGEGARKGGTPSPVTGPGEEGEGEGVEDRGVPLSGLRTRYPHPSPWPGSGFGYPSSLTAHTTDRICRRSYLPPKKQSGHDQLIYPQPFKTCKL